MESSVIFQGISETLGTVSLLAKGYKRPKSKIRGEIDLFSISIVIFYPKETREVHTLQDARLVESLSGFISDYESVKKCSEIGKIILKTTTLDTSSSIFNLYAGLLYEVNSRNRCNRELYYGTLIKIMHLYGLFPKINSCVKCGSKAIKYISPRAGGPLCNRCASEYDDIILVSAGTLKEIFFLLTREFGQIATFKMREETVNILNSLLKEHLYEEKDQENSV